MRKEIPSLVKYSKPLIIPKSINIELLINNNPPNRKEVTRDCILHLLQLLYSKSLYYNSEDNYKEEGFIPLKMEYLNNDFHASRENLNYLISLGIIETDNKYIPRVVSIGYRINPNYLNGETQTLYFKRRVHYERIRKNHDSEESNLPIPSYLAKPFREKRISLDMDRANKILEEFYNKQIELINQNDKLSNEEKEQKVRNKIYALKIGKEKITRICYNDYEGSYFIDNTCFRFNSLITSLKKQVRPIIRLDGQKTVSFDLKNSQPFFFLLLLKKPFYENRNRERKILRMLNIDKNSREYREYIIRKINNNNINPLMIGKMAKSIENTGGSVFEFCQAIREGTLYELFMSKLYDIKALQPEQYESVRARVKEQFLVYLYDIPDRESGKRSVKSIIQKEYPEIFEFIAILKAFKTGETVSVKHSHKPKKGYRKRLIKADSGYKRLSLLIQRIESKVILEAVCSKIARNHPEMSFLTVHDSIIVPDSYRKVVKNIIETEIERLTWEKPTIKVE